MSTSKLPAATTLDEMLEAPTGSGLQPTPLPNTKSRITCHTEIMKEIIGRGLGL